jgi:uncharacterized protein (DUF433 family)
MTTPAITEISTLLESKPGVLGGRLCLRGTRISVHNVAGYYRQGISAEEMAANNRDLSPALFHAAVAYYLANKERIDAEMDEDERYGREMAAKYPVAWTRDDVLREG